MSADVQLIYLHTSYLDPISADVPAVNQVVELLTYKTETDTHDFSAQHY
jgi:hypothetical protein